MSLIENGIFPEGHQVPSLGYSVSEHWRVEVPGNGVWRAKQVLQFREDGRLVNLWDKEQFDNFVVRRVGWLLDVAYGFSIPETQFFWRPVISGNERMGGWIVSKEIEGRALRSYEKVDSQMCLSLQKYLKNCLQFGMDALMANNGDQLWLPDLLGGYQRDGLPNRLQNLIVDKQQEVWLVDVWPLIRMNMRGERVDRWKYARRVLLATERDRYGDEVAEIGRQLAGLVYPEDEAPNQWSRVISNIF